MACLKTGLDHGKRRENSSISWDYSYYILLLVPFILFLVSLYIPPTIISDSGGGFLALCSMFAGGAFNSITTPDPANIANDIVTFLTWWSPGQYLVPGIFIWLGTSYGLALSLTTLVATLIGVAGWIRVARGFAVSSFVLFVFVLGLTTFPYVTQRFLAYWGGELLLFAVAPWSLYVMRWSVNKPPILCFTISLLSAALLFFAKLTGLIVFATNVMAISLFTLISQRRLSSSIILMWVASGITVLCFMIFWVARGPVGEWSTASFSWFPIRVSMAAAAFSGIYGLGLFLSHPWMQINPQWTIELLGPVGLLLMMWAWYRLRHTPYRDMAVLLLLTIVIYAITVAINLQYLRGVGSIEDRHFRYAGILFFLLLLTAVDQWRAPLAKSLACGVVIVLGLYGLRNYATFAHGQMRAGHYESTTGISQEISPAALNYMRSEATKHNFQRPIAVILAPAAAISLPRFRIIVTGADWEQQLLASRRWAGRAERIFVVLPEEAVLSGEAEAILRSFADYDFSSWTRMKVDGMIIYNQ